MATAMPGTPYCFISGAMILSTVAFSCACFSCAPCRCGELLRAGSAAWTAEIEARLASAPMMMWRKFIQVLCGVVKKCLECVQLRRQAAQKCFLGAWTRRAAGLAGFQHQAGKHHRAPALAGPADKPAIAVFQVILAVRQHRRSGARLAVDFPTVGQGAQGGEPGRHVIRMV